MSLRITSVALRTVRSVALRRIFPASLAASRTFATSLSQPKQAILPQQRSQQRAYHLESTAWSSGSPVKDFPQKQFHAASLNDPEAFWAAEALKIDWIKFPKRILTPSNESPDGRWKWFEGGQLNTAYNCLGRWTKTGRANQPALIWDSAYTNSRKTFTYKQVEEEVDKVAAMLQEHGVKKGDRVVVYVR